MENENQLTMGTIMKIIEKTFEVSPEEIAKHLGVDVEVVEEMKEHGYSERFQMSSEEIYTRIFDPNIPGTPAYNTILKRNKERPRRTTRIRQAFKIILIIIRSITRRRV